VVQTAKIDEFSVNCIGGVTDLSLDLLLSRRADAGVEATGRDSSSTEGASQVDTFELGTTCKVKCFQSHEDSITVWFLIDLIFLYLVVKTIEKTRRMIALAIFRNRESNHLEG